jgi:hypothetical protein
LADLPLGLILIRQKVLVGQMPGDHKVYKITKIAVIPLSEEEPLELELEVRDCDEACFIWALYGSLSTQVVLGLFMQFTHAAVNTLQ